MKICTGMAPYKKKWKDKEKKIKGKNSKARIIKKRKHTELPKCYMP